MESELDSPGESELGLRVIVEKAKSRQLSKLGQSGETKRPNLELRVYGAIESRPR